MTVKDIHDRVRRRLDDLVGGATDSLWKPDEIIDEYANKVITDLCRMVYLNCDRGIITDSSTINEVLATGTITIAGASGSINSVSVNDVVVTSAAVPFNGTLAQTATDLAANITAKTSSPNYTASASGAVVTISAVSGTGATPNGYVIGVVSTTLTATIANMSGGSAVTRLYLVPDQAVYDINEKILGIVRIKPSEGSQPLIKKTVIEMDQSYPSWEDADSGTPLYYIPDRDEGKITIYPAPETADTAYLTVYRLPLVDLSISSLSTIPEINSLYHADLIPGILKYCFEKNDEETFRPNLALKFEAQFARVIEVISQELLSKHRTSTTNSVRKAFR